MNKVFEAAAELQNVCQSQGWQFCFIGGLALQRWSEPRETVDVAGKTGPILNESSSAKQASWIGITSTSNLGRSRN
ncbi:MAG TPA: hypothetical protein VFT48_01720 [Pyrinomonadaceae bacterium]|nr:hypothetical protein [Pyrinomonadaceae bacterium]